jgi:cysteine desulfurase
MIFSKLKNITKLNKSNKSLIPLVYRSKNNFTETCSKETISKSLDEVKDKINIRIEKQEDALLKKSNVIFFDFQSTTPIDPRVFDAMFPHMTYLYGNPHSKSHEYGWNAEDAVEIARSVYL